MHGRYPLPAVMALATSIMLGACASAPPPPPGDALSEAAYAIEQARQAIANESRSLPLYEAQTKLQRARKLADAEDDVSENYAEARRLAERATLDARLAEADARRVKAEDQKAEMQESLEILRRELKLEEGTQ